MRYVSTRGGVPAVEFRAALNAGLAFDGGLYVPEKFPDLPEISVALEYPEFAARLLKPFVQPDPLAGQLTEICRAAFNFSIPLRLRGDKGGVLELFHGPTAAFKDVGARFLAECVTREPMSGNKTVIVATSGDTGGAVAAAFAGKSDVEVLVLYPKGKISARQERQIACWGGNVRAFAVHGTFDDCQRVVKEALRDPDWRRTRTFISANSISVGRLLPQMIYYAKSSLQYVAWRGVAPGFIVPTGNLGNGVAALWAKRLGFPIRQVALATNANAAISEYFKTGIWCPRPTIATLANAMDVGEASNFERLRALYPDLSSLLADASAVLVSDTEITEAIRRGGAEVWCPHTATAVVAERKLGGRDWILVATAHPAKFETIVEPLIGHVVEMPPTLKVLLERTPRSLDLQPSLAALKSAVN